MKQCRMTAAFLVLLFITFFPVKDLLSGSDTITIDDFQKYGKTPFPGWTFEGDYNRAVAIYSIVQEDGKKFLRGSTFKLNKMIQLGKPLNSADVKGITPVKWDIYTHPYLSWEWRVRTIPDGANERNDKLNDSAASVYVVFQKAKVPLAGWQRQPANWIKYVWSSTLPVGTVVTKKMTKFGVNLYHGKYVVVASGKKNLGKWITFKRNVLADYRNLFGSEPTYHPAVLGIVTDSNSSKGKAEADYDNIAISGN